MRATVWRSSEGAWCVNVADGESCLSTARFASFGEAVSFALAQVGLATPLEHREAP